MLLLNGKTDKTLHGFKGLLLAEWEPKAYFTLLALGELKPWEVARMSEILQARIYWILDELKEKRLVEQTNAKPIRVKAVYLGIALEQFKSDRIVKVNKATASKRFLESVPESLENMKERYEGQLRVFESNRMEVTK